MDTSSVREQLMRIGQAPVVQAQSHHPKISPVAPKSEQHPKSAKPLSPKPTATTATPSAVDDFQLMYIKSRVFGVNDNIIRDVLQSCNDDAVKAIEELESMGFEDRFVDDTPSPGDHKRLVVDTLSSEFPFAARQHIMLVADNCQLNMDETRKTLKKEEAMRQLSSQFSQLDSKIISSALDQCDLNLAQARPLLLAYIQDVKDKKASEERKKAAEVQVHLNDKASPSRSSPDRRLSPKKRKSPSKSVHSGIYELPGAGPPTRRIIPRKFQSSYKTCAIGPDPNNAHGPDASLLGNGVSLAIGPDPTYCKGPQPSLLLTAK